ncbi:ribonuclease Z [Pantoea sp. 1.19]|uniref:ribonuclease Z n=1 Tax=Pantoea sp. 1.19 TaxID=1925589 RepID=UPI000948D3BE|nr:ribonuclease Z [Pantoea sp. 1.19]
MELLFLGTCAGTPSKARNVTSIALNIQDNRNISWLFDCGEGTQHQILRTAIRPGKITRLFITHLHGDHLFGLPGLLTSRSMLGVTEPLTLYGPAGLKTWVESTLSLSGSWLTFPLEIVEVSGGEICDDGQFRVTAWPLNHPVTCYGYRIEEHHRPGGLDVERLRAEGIPPGPVYQRLKRGETVSLEDGRVLRGADYLGRSLEGRKLAIFGDTAPCEAALALAKGVDLMVHETTLEAAMAEKANARGHSTTEQAAALAKAAGARRLIATHFSARYSIGDCQRLLAECQAIFPATELAYDFSLFSLPAAIREG